MSVFSGLKSAARWDKAFAKTLLMVALPMVIQNLVSSTLNIIDNIMVGQLGAAAHAGVSQALNYTFLFNLSSFLYPTGRGIIAPYFNPSVNIYFKIFS